MEEGMETAPVRKLQRKRGPRRQIVIIPGVGIQGHEPDCDCNTCKKESGRSSKPDKKRAGFEFSKQLLKRLSDISRKIGIPQAEIARQALEQRVTELENKEAM